MVEMLVVLRRGEKGKKRERGSGVREVGEGPSHSHP